MPPPLTPPIFASRCHAISPRIFTPPALFSFADDATLIFLLQARR